jgi:hypothetical protein
LGSLFFNGNRRRNIEMSKRKLIDVTMNTSNKTKNKRPNEQEMLRKRLRHGKEVVIGNSLGRIVSSLCGIQKSVNSCERSLRITK